MATNWNELARDVKIYKTASNTRKTARGVAVLNQQVAQQTAQLQAMHSDLARLQSLEEQRQRTADYENKLRDLIFEQEVRIQAMRKLVERAPAAVYVATTVLQTQFAQLRTAKSITVG